MTEYLQLTTTVDSPERASLLSRGMVEKRLVACAQVMGPIQSTYWWQGKIEETEEWMILAKTRANRVDELLEFLRTEHPYETFEAIVMPIVAGNQKYLNWISSETEL
ncbi:MAG: divalent-cation tolerance protein CutA [Candidatus Dormibacteraceae bacterium]